MYSLETGVLVLLTAFHAEIPAAKTLLHFALKSHINAFLASVDDILRDYAAIGNDPHVSDGIFRQTERYICLLYKPANSKFESLLIEFRWALFSKFGKEGKQLPPTMGTLVPRTRRASYLALVFKMSTMPCLKIPLATAFSWIERETATSRAVHCSTCP